jgi:hypothetical protein
MLSSPRAMTTRPMPRRLGRRAATPAAAASRAIGIKTKECASSGVRAPVVGGVAAARPAYPGWPISTLR